MTEGGTDMCGKSTRKVLVGKLYRKRPPTIRKQRRDDKPELSVMAFVDWIISRVLQYTISRPSDRPSASQ